MPGRNVSILSLKVKASENSDRFRTFVAKKRMSLNGLVGISIYRLHSKTIGNDIRNRLKGISRTLRRARGVFQL